METLVSELQDGQTMEELTKDMKYYSYYLEAYTAVLGGMVGEFEIQVPKEENSNEKDPEKVWVRKYGLKAFSRLQGIFPMRTTTILAHPEAMATNAHIWGMT